MSSRIANAVESDWVTWRIPASMHERSEQPEHYRVPIVGDLYDTQTDVEVESSTSALPRSQQHSFFSNPPFNFFRRSAPSRHTHPRSSKQLISTNTHRSFQLVQLLIDRYHTLVQICQAILSSWCTVVRGEHAVLGAIEPSHSCVPAEPTNTDYLNYSILTSHAPHGWCLRVARPPVSGNGHSQSRTTELPMQMKVLFHITRPTVHEDARVHSREVNISGLSQHHTIAWLPQSVVHTWFHSSRNDSDVSDETLWRMRYEGLKTHNVPGFVLSGTGEMYAGGVFHQIAPKPLWGIFNTVRLLLTVGPKSWDDSKVHVSILHGVCFEISLSNISTPYTPECTGTQEDNSCVLLIHDIGNFEFHHDVKSALFGSGESDDTDHIHSADPLMTEGYLPHTSIPVPHPMIVPHIFHPSAVRANIECIYMSLLRSLLIPSVVDVQRILSLMRHPTIDMNMYVTVPCDDFFDFSPCGTLQNHLFRGRFMTIKSMIRNKGTSSLEHYGSIRATLFCIAVYRCQDALVEALLQHGGEDLDINACTVIPYAGTMMPRLEEKKDDASHLSQCGLIHVSPLYLALCSFVHRVHSFGPSSGGSGSHSNSGEPDEKHHPAHRIARALLLDPRCDILNGLSFTSLPHDGEMYQANPSSPEACVNWLDPELCVTCVEKCPPHCPSLMQLFQRRVEDLIEMETSETPSSLAV